MPPILTCPVPKNKTAIKRFSSKVHQYDPETTTITMYHCVHLIHNMYCNEGFFADKDKDDRGYIAGRVKGLRSL